MLCARGRKAIHCALLVGLVGLGGCAGTSSTGSTVTGSTLKIYAGLSPSGSGGQQAQDVLDAERLALQQAGGQVGRFKVVLKPVAQSKISDNARTAISDSSAIAYIGDLMPDASADSLGITNGVGMLQVSPTDTSIALTQTTKAVSNSPTRYYESLKTNGRTFGRVVPAANREAVVQVKAMQAAHITHLYVTDDRGAYGKSIALAVVDAARGAGISVTSGPADPARIKASLASGLFIGGNDAAYAVRQLGTVAATVPRLKLFVPSALATAPFPADLQRSIVVSQPGFLVAGPHANVTPAGRKFISDFKTAYHRDPSPAAMFGYEAMGVVLDALRRAGSNAGSRSAVVSQFQKTKQRVSVLGTYSIDVNGDTSLAPYVLARVRAGKLVPYAALQG